jgi:peptidoglycan/LPS O-acetylase OafA/YrhL
MNRTFSLYLDFVRFMAALSVLLFHASGFDCMTAETGVGRYGREAVVVFFVLSGFVIAYTAQRKDHTLAEYSIHRISRIYSVVLPALLITVIVDRFGIALHPEFYVEYDAQSSWPIRLLISVFCLNEWGFWSVQFFSNVPYWSISYEIGYYILFGIGFYLKGRMSWLLLSAFGVLAGPRVLLLLPIWLLGVWVYRSQWLSRMSRKTAVIAIVGSLIGWAVVVDGGWAGRVGDWLSELIGAQLWRIGLGWSRFFLTDYLVGILVAINFSAVRVIVADANVTSVPLIKAIRLLSLLTFPLYLLHQPLLLFFASLSPTQLSVTARFVLVVVSTLGAVAIVTPLCEFLRAQMRVFLANFFELAKARWSIGAILPARDAPD